MQCTNQRNPLRPDMGRVLTRCAGHAGQSGSRAHQGPHARRHIAGLARYKLLHSNAKDAAECGSSSKRCEVDDHIQLRPANVGAGVTRYEDSRRKLDAERDD